jgi:1,4-alpha-glucan branching enzyme
MMKKYKTIRLEAPQAQEVFIAGTFNDWNARSLPMQRVRNGEWSVDVPLAMGHHEFKFIVDGHWCCDVGPNGPVEAAVGCVPNAFGTMNRVLDIPA